MGSVVGTSFFNLGDGALSPYVYGKRHCLLSSMRGRLICHRCMQMVLPWSFFVGVSLEKEREIERDLQHMDVCVSSIPLGQSLWYFWVYLDFRRVVWSLGVYLNVVMFKRDDIQLISVTWCFIFIYMYIYMYVCSIDKNDNFVVI